MPTFESSIKLILQGPILTQGSTPADPGVDAAIAREHGQAPGLPLLAHSLIKGRLRQSWEELYSTTGDPALTIESIRDWLGPDPRFGKDLDQSNEPQRARLEFSDLKAANPPPRPLRHRVAIDPETGAADEHMLLMLESPWRPDEPVEFHGTVCLHAWDETQAKEMARWVGIGLRWTLSFGAERTIGFGRLIEATVGPPRSLVSTTPLRTWTANPGEAAESSLDLVITPRSPFCIARHRREENLFVSDDQIPGGVIKGCVAEVLKRCGALPARAGSDYELLAKHLDALVFRHAFPVVGGERRRPVAVPESVVKGGGGWHDLALLGNAGLVAGEAPAFQVDWKDDSDVRQEFGWPPPLERELRVRTAIDRKRLRAEDEMLFAQERVVPDGHEWLGRVDLAAVPEAERPEVAGQLRELLSAGLFSLGKTKARADVEVLPPGRLEAAQPTESPGDGLWVLTLQTPALLGWPEEFAQDDPRHGGSYEEAWADLSSSGEKACLKLKHFYARQFMAGGGYLRHRFQKDRPYNPWLLTAPGSVFVLEGVDDSDEAGKHIEQWQRTGLPLPGWVRTAWELTGDPAKDWKRCPYLPENGYGEIAVNLACHGRKNPGSFQPCDPCDS